MSELELSRPGTLHETYETLLKRSDAVFSNDGRYRFWLQRRWDAGPLVNFVMANPSEAGAARTDPTDTRCESRARELRYSGYVLTNAFALKSSDPIAIRHDAEPVGEHNNHYITLAARLCSLVICAWGRNGRYRNRDCEVKALIRAAGRPLYYLRLSKLGAPEHPLYLPYDLKPTPWENDAI